MSVRPETLYSSPDESRCPVEAVDGFHHSRLIAPHMARVEERLRELVAPSDPRLAEIALHLIEAGGRRLRPALVLASGIAARGSDAVSSRVIDAAVAVELLHLASLFHDDVLDSAPVRRGRATANALWGAQIAVLAGDALLAQAFSLAADLSREELQRFSRTVTALCSGQVAETEMQFEQRRGVGDYEAAIRAKTAALLASSCWLGASTADAPIRVLHALERYGEELGIAFQLVDDLLDLYGDPDLTGKVRGADLRAGVFTLPVLLALEKDPALRELLIEAVDEAGIEEVRRRVTAAGADGRTLSLAEERVACALACLKAVELHAEGSEVLVSIAESVLDLVARSDYVAAGTLRESSATVESPTRLEVIDVEGRR